MGYRIAYLAVAEDEKETLLRVLRLVATKRTEEAPESAWTATRLSSGFFFLQVNEAAPGTAAALAAVASRSIPTVIAGSVNETTMVSEAGVFERGQESWWTRHEWGASENLEVRGNAPEGVGDLLRAAVESSDEEVDEVFDVPVRLFESITGFRYGYDTAEPFVVLRERVSRMVLASPLASKAEVLDTLALRETVRRGDFLAQAWWATETRKGLWVLTSMDGDKRVFGERERLAKKGVSCCVCAANEANLFSFFAREDPSDPFWFELRHLGRDGANSFDVRGNVPGRVRQWIREAREATARTPDVHYLWQVPIDAFEAETGHSLRDSGSSAIVLEPR